MAALRAPAAGEQQSVGALVGRLGSDVRRIVRAEVALLQVRLNAGLDAAKTAGAGLAIGAVLALAGLGAVIAGVVLVVALWIPLWISAFAVGGGVLIVSAVVIALEIRGLTRGVRIALKPPEERRGD